MYPSTVQPLCTHVDKLVTSNLQICFPAPYLSLHAKYSHMPEAKLAPVSPIVAVHELLQNSAILRHDPCLRLR